MCAFLFLILFCSFLIQFVGFPLLLGYAFEIWHGALAAPPLHSKNMIIFRFHSFARRFVFFLLLLLLLCTLALFDLCVFMLFLSVTFFRLILSTCVSAPLLTFSLITFFAFLSCDVISLLFSLFLLLVFCLSI